jgi:COMPASS component SPP1
MEPPDHSAPQDEQQSNAPAEAAQIKSESLSGDALYLTTQTLAPSQSVATSWPASSDSPQPLPSTETHDSAAAMPTASASKKKKGTAATKKAPKRARQGISKKSAKKAKAEPQKNSATPAGSDEDGEDESDDESDHGPYCICRGPDDHRWMICCEKCEDWFHGECIKLSKDIGESLIEKFICPNCTKGGFSTIYKKTCALKACRKPSRLVNNRQSVFCSNEHAATWWERMVGRLPKGKTKSSLNDQLTQDEFMALLSSGLVGVGDDGVFRLATTPFTGKRDDGCEFGTF